ncbi:hypothetical protein CW304_28850 [Bacillus sp. UFRGS-B20]|nr:hypothetical protein CW304_28850 [Bacillus sp. UFRGS-B20]
MYGDVTSIPTVFQGIFAISRAVRLVFGRILFFREFFSFTRIAHCFHLLQKAYLVRHIFHQPWLA